MTIIIKKYPNRRLYNTEISEYITLDNLKDLVKKNIDFVVQDAKSGEDLTRITLTQIIFDLESSGDALLPINFLKQLINFYDDSLSSVIPVYLDKAMQSFVGNQELFRNYYNQYMGQMAKQNLDLFEQSLKLFFTTNDDDKNNRDK
jgi:polyhydroxyalkanoate synthesis repressor PhaR